MSASMLALIVVLLLFYIIQENLSRKHDEERHEQYRLDRDDD